MRGLVEGLLTSLSSFPFFFLDWVELSFSTAVSNISHWSFRSDMECWNDCNSWEKLGKDCCYVYTCSHSLISFFSCSLGSTLSWVLSPILEWGFVLFTRSMLLNSCIFCRQIMGVGSYPYLLDITQLNRPWRIEPSQFQVDPISPCWDTYEKILPD